ncbi:MAG: GNAT family N-acetyltransferase [Clostridia bacterium]|nr:GNAT family N-acetyltransferase [Clostridia bacterium]
MDMFYYETPNITRQADAVDYIEEFLKYGSDINGSGGLHRYLNDYSGWLRKLEEDYARMPNEEKVPALTYFLVREGDGRIVGMSNIRLTLNSRLRRFGGHIGYSIRPSERGKGYNNINLYLALTVCARHGIGEVFMDADKNNPASWKTMEALGGTRVREHDDEENARCTVVDYTIDVEKALRERADLKKHLSADPIRP